MTRHRTPPGRHGQYLAGTLRRGERPLGWVTRVGSQLGVWVRTTERLMRIYSPRLIQLRHDEWPLAEDEVLVLDAENLHNAGVTRGELMVQLRGESLLLTGPESARTAWTIQERLRIEHNPWQRKFAHPQMITR